jgi:hypothetical protein
MIQLPPELTIRQVAQGVRGEVLLVQGEVLQVPLVPQATQITKLIARLIAPKLHL